MSLMFTSEAIIEMAVQYIYMWFCGFVMLLNQ